MPRRSEPCWLTLRSSGLKAWAEQDMQKREKAAGPFDFFLLLLLGIFWGIPYALKKIALTTIPPITMVAARVLLAAVSLWIVVWFTGGQKPKSWYFMPQ